MRKTLHLKSRPALESTYRRLLRQEWGKQTLEEVLDLLEQQLSAAGARIRLPGDPQLKRAKARDIEINARAVFPEIRRLLAALHHGGLPPVPDLERSEVAGKRSLQRTALRATLHLMLQSQFDLQGDSALFADAQSLLFLNVVDALLPSLKAAKLREEHDLLVNVLAYHCTHVWRDDAAHQQFLLSMLAHYLGDADLEERALHASFRLTPPSEHDYLTKAQAYWMHLLDRDRYEDAKDFLLSVYREAPPELLPELRRMIDESAVLAVHD